MKRLMVLAAVLLGVVPVVAPAAPNVASSAFTRFANSPAGKPLFDVQIAATAGTESWTVSGHDIVPFYYEQGMAQSDGRLVHSSRNSLTRTAVGCSAPLDPLYGECYDVREENPAPIPPDLMARGVNHVGGIDIGPASGGPGAGVVFAPLETDPPRTVRGFGAYDADSLSMVGLLVEETAHRYNSWVTVDPSARYMIASEDGMDPIRVYEISKDSSGAVGLERRADLDLTGTTPAGTLPNFQGCKFADALTLYCANWAKRNSYFDVGTEIFRVNLSAPVGSVGATASGALAFSSKATPNYGVTSNTPYGLETEDLAFWDGELHVQVRGETLGWFHIVHLRKV